MRRSSLTVAFCCTLLHALAGSAWESPAQSPADLVRATVQHEIQSAQGGAKFLFREHKRTQNGSQTKIIIETREMMAGMLVAVNDQPLPADQRQAEYRRVQRFVNDPAERRKRERQEKEDADRTKRIMTALPDAFLYQWDGTEPGSEKVGRNGHDLVRLKFSPNPKYSPPSNVEQILTGMQGNLLIDNADHRIAKIEGTLFKEVGFGWGILGHLDRGGRFMVQQADIGGGNWEVTRMDLALTGKALFFKSINFSSVNVFSDFQAAPSDLSIAQGIELLKKEEAAMLALNQQPRLEEQKR
ncbi:MAG: hypothetical protein M3O09_14250 [Acidobacteriota bacterium]|nr:hypothetical protein [Acidobacteriota bacterium]